MVIATIIKRTALILLASASIALGADVVWGILGQQTYTGSGGTRVATWYSPFAIASPSNGMSFGKAPSFSTQLSLSVWVNIKQDAGSGKGVLSKDSDTAQRCWNFSAVGRQFRVRLWQTDGTLKEQWTGGTYATNVWMHVGVIADGSKIQTFTNGFPAGASTAYDGTISNSVNTPLVLSSYFQYTDTYNLFADYDELAVWNRAITWNEMTNLSAGVYGNIAVAPFSSGLVLGCHFDEGAGTNAVDYSGNNYTGRTIRATWTTGRVSP